MTASKSNAWVLVITPRRSVAVETVTELGIASRAAGISVEHYAGPNALGRSNGKVIRVITAGQLLQAISQRHPARPLTGLDLVVCENLEQLDSTYELAVSLLLHATQTSPTRFVGFSDSLNDPADLADWLDVDALALHSFRPRDRDQSLNFITQTFTIPHSASLFKAMAKPAHAAIRGAPPTESAIVFVPSRGQCRTIARDLITQCALEMETERGYLPDGVRDDRLEDYLVRLQDPTLVEFVAKGLGFFHEGIKKPDRFLMLELYAEGILRVLIVPRESCWTVPVRAAVVVVMGTQYMHFEDVSVRQLRDYGLTELVRMRGRAVRHTGTGHFHLFCQAEAKDTFARFLDEGLPLESQLLETPDLATWYRAQKQDLDAPPGKQHIVDALSFTFLARRIVSNPAYYDCTTGSRDENLSRIVDTLADQATIT